MIILFFCISEFYTSFLEFFAYNLRKIRIYFFLIINENYALKVFLLKLDSIL